MLPWWAFPLLLAVVGGGTTANSNGSCCFLCGAPPMCSSCLGCWDTASFCSVSQETCTSMCRGYWCNNPAPPQPPPPPPPLPTGDIHPTLTKRLPVHFNTLGTPVVQGAWVFWSGSPSLDTSNPSPSSVIVYGQSIDGNASWSTPLVNATLAELSGIVYADGRVYQRVSFGTSRSSMNASLFALDAITGDMLWQRSVSVLSSFPAAGDGGVYYVESNSSLMAVEGGTGVFRWTVDTESSVGQGPAFVDGVVYQAGIEVLQNYVFALNPATGDNIWKHPIRTVSWTPAVASDKASVFISTTFFSTWQAHPKGEPDGRLEAVDGYTGFGSWGLDMAAAIGQPVAWHNGRTVVLFTSCTKPPSSGPPTATSQLTWSGCSLWAIDAEKAASVTRDAVLWVFHSSTVLGTPQVGGGVVFVASHVLTNVTFANCSDKANCTEPVYSNTTITAILAHTGTPLWSHRVEGAPEWSVSPWSSFAVDHEGKTLVYNTPGGVYFLDVSARPPSGKGSDARASFWLLVAVLGVGVLMAAILLWACTRRSKPHALDGDKAYLINASPSPSEAGEGGCDLGEGFEEVRVLGRGGFSTVYLVRKGGALYSLKRIDCRTEAELNMARNEVELLKELPPHPGIIDILGYFTTPSHLSLVLPYYEQGDLATFISTFPAAVIPEPTILSFMSQLCNVLHHLHSLSPPVVHRDLKPANILLTSDRTRLVITDFGLARSVNQTYLHTHAGTMAFMAPEAFDGPYDTKVDIWSVGCIAYAMVERLASRHSVMCVRVAHRGFYSSLADTITRRGYSALLVDLIRQMLQVSRHARPSAEEVLFRLGEDAPPTLRLGESSKRGGHIPVGETPTSTATESTPSSSMEEASPEFHAAPVCPYAPFGWQTHKAGELVAGGVAHPAKES
eukprot:Sspe_Gene.34334::Locus_16706_Transcript_1_1_Confidence_1.000_Length_2960::g.34334::m.34334/K20877/NEK8; NIMA (never in mitosis gene a)-related kinase 8